MRNGDTRFSESALDVREEEHSNVMIFDESVEFYIKGIYSRFSASIVPAQYYETNKWGNVCVVIKADGKEIYRSKTINYKTEILNVNVDLHKAKYISFDLVPIDDNNLLLGNHQILICNPELSK